MQIAVTSMLLCAGKSRLGSGQGIFDLEKGTWKCFGVKPRYDSNHKLMKIPAEEVPFRMTSNISQFMMMQSIGEFKFLSDISVAAFSIAESRNRKHEHILKAYLQLFFMDDLSRAFNSSASTLEELAATNVEAFWGTLCDDLVPVLGDNSTNSMKRVRELLLMSKDAKMQSKMPISWRADM